MRRQGGPAAQRVEGTHERRRRERGIRQRRLLRDYRRERGGRNPPDARGGAGLRRPGGEVGLPGRRAHATVGRVLRLRAAADADPRSREGAEGAERVARGVPAESPRMMPPDVALDVKLSFRRLPKARARARSSPGQPTFKANSRRTSLRGRRRGRRRRYPPLRADGGERRRRLRPRVRRSRVRPYGSWR